MELWNLSAVRQGVGGRCKTYLSLAGLTTIAFSDVVFPPGGTVESPLSLGWVYR